MPNPPSSTGPDASKVELLTIEGPGWRNTYEVKPDGTRVLIHSFSSLKKPHNHNDATRMTLTEEMSWAEFCRQFRDNTSYDRL